MPTLGFQALQLLTRAPVLQEARISVSAYGMNVFVSRQLCWNDHLDFRCHAVCGGDGWMDGWRLLVNQKGKRNVIWVILTCHV